MLVFAAE